MNFETTFTHNNRTYTFVQQHLDNSLKFELIRDVMFGFNYNQFNENFYTIYNTFHSDQIKPICYMIKTIADEYMAIKNQYNTVPIGSIISNLEDRALIRLGRRNSKKFHIKFIAMIVCWVRFKTNENEWLTIDFSPDVNLQWKVLYEFYTVQGKINKIISHFDLTIA